TLGRPDQFSGGAATGMSGSVVEGEGRALGVVPGDAVAVRVGDGPGAGAAVTTRSAVARAKPTSSRASIWYVPGCHAAGMSIGTSAEQSGLSLPVAITVMLSGLPRPTRTG